MAETCKEATRYGYSVKTHMAMPVPSFLPSVIDGDFDGGPRVSAVGVGEFGARMVEVLSRTVPGITCHEITQSPFSELPRQIPLLLCLVQQSDLVFILTDPERTESIAIAQEVVSASCDAGVLTIIVVPQGQDTMASQRIVEDLGGCFTGFCVSESCLPTQQGQLYCNALTGYTMRHVVAVITTLITHVSGICFDFADLRAVIRRGRFGRVGIGVGAASDPARGEVAALAALERLKSQSCHISDASGVLAAVHGSSALTMEDFDNATKIIQEAVGTDTDFVVGLISDEYLGGNVKVTIMLVC